MSHLAILVHVFLLVFLIIIISGYITTKYFNNLYEKHINQKFKEVECVPLNDVEKRGLEGEIAVNSHIRTLLKKEDRYLTSLLIPSTANRYVEIDGILITRKGIFCIETKNWKGRINGFECDEMWYKSKKGYLKQVKNPVIQNKYHCEVVERSLHFNFEVENCVIFSSTNDLTHIISNSVFNLDTFDDFYFSKTKKKLSKRQIDHIYSVLSAYRVTHTEMRKYKEEFKTKYLSV